MKKSAKFRPPPKPKVELTGLHKTLIDAIALQSAMDESEITLDSTFDGDLGFDSLDGIELIMALEEELKLEWLDEDEFMPCKTVGEVLAKLTPLVEAQPKPVE